MGELSREMITSIEQVYGEVKTMREEQIMLAGTKLRQLHILEDNEKRIRNLWSPNIRIAHKISNVKRVK